ncbi:hypothetical protein OTU49_014892, partial [Cherax quadricarinatus]
MLSPGVLMIYAVPHHVLLSTEREAAARKWAPVVWLHPDEHHYPSSVNHFLRHVRPSIAGSKEPQSTVNGETVILMPSLPVGKPSQESYLLAPNNFECSNCALPR